MSTIAIVALVAALIGGCATVSPITSGAPTESPAATPPASEGHDVPLIETQMEGPTVIDVTTELVGSGVVTPAGATVQGDGVTLNVPAGGVATDTTLVINRLGPFHLNVFAHSEPTDVAATPIGHPYDLGPAGVLFEQPAELTLAYDPQYVPAGTDPGQIGIAYFNGNRWVSAGGAADPVAHTITVRLQALEGVAVIPIAVAVGITINRAIHWYYGGEGTTNDPISANTAASYITPEDPTVMDMALKATVDGIPLDDKEQLAEYLKQHPASTPVTLQDRDGNPRTLQGRWSDDAGSNWQKPVDYLSPAPRSNAVNAAGQPPLSDMRGDCTDVANAMVSMFRFLGYPAKTVFGYREDITHPHVWGEVLVGDTPYLIDENGQLQPIDDAMSVMKFIRPEPGDPRAFMWDENGQTPYEDSWWTQYMETPTPTPPPPTIDFRWVTASVDADVQISEGPPPVTCPATVYLEFVVILPPASPGPSSTPPVYEGLYAIAGTRAICSNRPFQPFEAEGTFDGHNFVFDRGGWHLTGTFDGVTATITGGPGDATYVFDVAP